MADEWHESQEIVDAKLGVICTHSSLITHVNGKQSLTVRSTEHINLSARASPSAKFYTPPGVPYAHIRHITTYHETGNLSGQPLGTHHAD